jgi:hypothetical protein
MEVSIDFGATWQRPTLEAAHNRYAWQRWRANITPPQAGYYEVWARATDNRAAASPWSCRAGIRAAISTMPATAFTSPRSEA